MKESEDYYNEETPLQRIPNDGIEEINIEPIDWDDMKFHILFLTTTGLFLLAY
jgi:hypothetical protein